MKLNEFMVINEGIHDKGIFKAIIMIGSAGSGKSYIIKKAIQNSNWKIINPDQAYVRAMKKAKISTDYRKQSDSQSMDSFDIHSDASEVTSKKAVHAITGRLPIIIDKTGRDSKEINIVKNQLENIGYEVLAVYVKVKEATAIKRNANRERSVELSYVKDAFKNIVKNIDTFKKMFGNNFLEIENEDNSKTNYNKIWININRWMNKEVNNDIAKEWKKNELKKIHKNK